MEARVIEILRGTFSPQKEVRLAAEAEISTMMEGVGQESGFATLLLELVANVTVPDDIRMSATVTFKNLVKKSWNTETSDQVVLENEKQTIRDNIFSVMVKCARGPRRVLTEAIALICETDFPAAWPNVIDNIVFNLKNSSDKSITDAGMSCAHGIFEKYRKVTALTEELKQELLIVNKCFTDPLLVCMQQLGHDLTTNPSKDSCKSLTMAFEVFHDITCIDIGHEHEARMEAFMTVLLDGLRMKPLNQINTELAQLKSIALETLALHMQKYDETFEPYAKAFMQEVWGVLQAPETMGSLYDDLAVRAMEFIAACCFSTHRKLLDDPATLKILCESIVLPNIHLTEDDIDSFEMEPDAYCERSVEGSDQHTRRRSACDLTRALLNVFQGKVSGLLMGATDALLQRYRTANDWKAKSAAIYLVMSMSLKGSLGSQRAVTELNPDIPVGTFFESEIVTELASPISESSCAILKTDCLHFVAVFRSHIDSSHFLQLLQYCNTWIADKNEVIQSFAAHTMERLLTVKVPKTSILVVDSASVMSAGVAETILSTICPIVASSKRPNQYLIQCLARICKFHSAISNVVSSVVLSMLGVISEASKNPSNPVFNHCLFETVSSCVAAAPQYGVQCSEALWPYFQEILQKDIVEFVPYTFQILGQLLDTFPVGSVPPHYRALLQPCLRPELYVHQGNIPAVVRLLTAFIRRDATWLHSEGHTGTLLGIFKRLVSKKSHDQDGISLLTSMILSYPQDIMDQYMVSIFQVLFTRLQSGKTQKYMRQLIQLFSTLIIVHGVSNTISRTNQVQAGIFWMFLCNIWLANSKMMRTEVEKKLFTISLTNIICESAELQQNREVWVRSVNSCVQLIKTKSEVNEATEAKALLLSSHLDVEEGFTNVFCPLTDATRPIDDTCPNISDAAGYLQTTLSNFLASNAELASDLHAKVPEFFTLSNKTF